MKRLTDTLRLALLFGTLFLLPSHAQTASMSSGHAYPTRPVRILVPLTSGGDLPTFAEAGVNGMVVVNWYGLIAPRRTPKAVIERIAKETATAMHSPEMTKRLTAESSDPVGSSPSEFAAYIRAEHEQCRVVKQAGIRGE